MSGLAIITYYWQPDPGSKFSAPYTPNDVRRLQRMVARHCTVPHQFVVITDRPQVFVDDANIQRIPTDRRTHVPGTCFVRLMTFHPEGPGVPGARIRSGTRLLQLDLDTIIVGNIDHLVNRTEDLVLWRNPARIPWADAELEPYLERNGVEIDPLADRDKYKCIVAEHVSGKKVYLTNQRRCLYNTSVLLHRCGTRPDLWSQVAAYTQRGVMPPVLAKDDQWYLSDVVGEDCPYFDGARDGVYRLPRDDTPDPAWEKGLPGNACIVTFAGSHGKADRPEIRAAHPWIEGYLR